MPHSVAKTTNKPKNIQKENTKTILRDAADRLALGVMHPRVRITGGTAGGGWGRGRHQNRDCQTWRKRTQDQADSEQMDVADQAPGTVQVGGGIGELVKIS